ncbi:uncharacterized protein LOC110226380 [Arabidopsis lyrata subsp. lyrata]|uniref:uncharacterized protein LOC110226380 n=1 Tax=Arabidopsis lyrata subsp. lyrata TaxID=81972 RepID=UPI000A29BF75|nr:uncharacterized protein LOC110226380 [Arabidopsis lyrata subsp. lyrata]|eukprot:XP_020873638.1 uncharacterized protein LOC110226380 [Arabidopsis lyrata subsp. lyrata]
MSVLEIEMNNVPIDEEPDDEDQEDQTARNDFNIEQVVIDFIDEPCIRHDVIPDSDSDEDDDVQRGRDRNEIIRGDGNLYMDQVFYNKIAFKEAVLDYALRLGRNIRQYRYDKTKLGYRCNVDVCGWRIYCFVSSKSDKWQVTRFIEKHSCTVNGECELIRVPVIARLFLDKIRDEPVYFMPMKIEELLMKKWKISVSRPQCQDARLKALKWIDKEYDEQFARIRDFGAEIEESNSGSTVEIDTLTNENGEDEFNRFYVCFDILRRTWKESCRPILGVDGCFVRGKTKGQLLVALGRDADNAIYPVA